MTIKELIYLKESEDKVEFKEAKGGGISFRGANKVEPSKRRRSILGYITAFANEGGGYLVFGIKESSPHIVVGSEQNKGSLGQLEANIYASTGIRVSTSEVFNPDDKRVVIINIPSRPLGKVYKFEDVALMRVGEELKPMSDERYLSIIQEQEPDFSQNICKGVTIDDLDDIAIKNMRDAYSKKQNNPQFQTLSKEQILSDLELTQGTRVTNAAVILLGKESTIKKTIPQSCIQLEYRKDTNNIRFDQRITFSGPFFVEADRLWKSINLRNGSFQIQEGPYIFDIQYFNREVIREAINNAVAHRNYRLTSETVIKQSASILEIISPGGFPIGVSLNNLISVSSTPRNRLLTDVLQKTGIVERSGQGIDKIFYQTLKEGKSEPDYSKSDDFQVELHLSAVIEDKAFALFLESEQQELRDEEKLSVQEIIHLNHIRKGDRGYSFDKKIIRSLLSRNLVEKRGKTSGTYYILSRAYYEFSDEKGKYSKQNWDKDQAFLVMLKHLEKFEKAKMQDFVDLFEGTLSRKQVRTNVDKLIISKKLKQNGKGKGTYYTIGDNHIENMKLLDKALQLGIEQLKNDGHI